MVMDKMHEGATKLASLAKQDNMQEIKAIMPVEIGLYPPEETLMQRDTRLGLSKRLAQAQEADREKQKGLWHGERGRNFEFINPLTTNFVADIFAKRNDRGYYPRWDGNDQVWRCPDCACEMEDTYCECGYEIEDYEEWSDRDNFDQNRAEMADIIRYEMGFLGHGDMDFESGEDFSIDDNSDADEDGNLAGFIDDAPPLPPLPPTATTAGARRRPLRVLSSDEEEENSDASVQVVPTRLSGARVAVPTAPTPNMNVGHVYDDDLDDWEVDDEYEDEDDFIDGPRHRARALNALYDDEDEERDDWDASDADSEFEERQALPQRRHAYIEDPTPTTDEDDDDDDPEDW